MDYFFQKNITFLYARQNSEEYVTYKEKYNLKFAISKG
jgi:hypothetical protein